MNTSNIYKAQNISEYDISTQSTIHVCSACWTQVADLTGALVKLFERKRFYFLFYFLSNAVIAHVFSSRRIESWSSGIVHIGKRVQALPMAPVSEVKCIQYTLNAKSTSLWHVGQTTGRPRCCAKRFQEVEHIQTCPQGTKAFDGLASLQITHYGAWSVRVSNDWSAQPKSHSLLAAPSARVGWVGNCLRPHLLRSEFHVPPPVLCFGSSTVFFPLATASPAPPSSFQITS